MLNKNSVSYNLPKDEDEGEIPGILPVTRYVSKADGKEFDTQERAKEHVENLCQEHLHKLLKEYSSKLNNSFSIPGMLEVVLAIIPDYEGAIRLSSALNKILR